MSETIFINVASSPIRSIRKSTKFQNEPVIGTSFLMQFPAPKSEAPVGFKKTLTQQQMSEGDLRSFTESRLIAEKSKVS